MMKNDIDILLEVLKIRTDSLVNYSNRVWIVFNWFLTLNIGALGLQYNQFNEVIDSGARLHYFVIGLVLTSLWLLIGVNDYESMKKHKSIKENIEKELRLKFYLNILNYQKGKSLIQFSQTKALFLAPIIFIIFWIYSYLAQYQF
jgi:hypothetical protein